MTPLLITVVLAYLMGSIPFGYILVRSFHGDDIRESGSGNIGATNVARSSPVLGIATLILDAAKGSVAVCLGLVVGRHFALPHSTIVGYAALAGFVAVLGHGFPMWLKFKGGKGVATAAGSFAVLAPKSVLLACVVFVIVVMAFRYVSLGSILAAASLPLLVWLLRDYRDQLMVLAYISLSSLLVVFKHHENIARLLRGTEPRFRWSQG